MNVNMKLQEDNVGNMTSPVTNFSSVYDEENKTIYDLQKYEFDTCYNTSLIAGLSGNYYKLGKLVIVEGAFTTLNLSVNKYSDYLIQNLPQPASPNGVALNLWEGWPGPPQ